MAKSFLRQLLCLLCLAAAQKLTHAAHSQSRLGELHVNPSSRVALRNTQKYPNLPGVFPSLTLIPKIFCCRGLHITTLTPWNFHEFATLGFPLPLENSISINNKNYIIYFYFLGSAMKIRCTYSWLYCRWRGKVAYFFTNNIVNLVWSHVVYFFITPYSWGYLLGQD